MISHFLRQTEMKLTLFYTDLYELANVLTSRRQWYPETESWRTVAIATF